MKRSWISWLVICSITAGCGPLDRRIVSRIVPPPVTIMPVASFFRAEAFDWSSIRRILLVPLANESSSPQAPAELAEALSSRIQSSGRFEVVVAAPGDGVTCLDSVRTHGRFDELELLNLAAAYQADAVLFGTVTQYQAYAPPQVGLSLRLISPSHGSLVASLDGLWDARDHSVADHARYYNLVVLNPDRSLLGGDLVLESPALFHRFACHEAAGALLGPELP